MTRYQLSTRSALLSILLASALTHAQEPVAEPESGTAKTSQTTSVVKEEVDWGFDKSEAQSRNGFSGTVVPGKTISIETSSEFKHVIDIEHVPTTVQCKSDIDIEYYQRDTEAEVRTVFTTEDCSAFDAAYQLQIMYFDAGGNFKRIVADEKWPEGQTGQHRTRYPLEAGSELRRVSSRILSCTCRTD